MFNNHLELVPLSLIIAVLLSYFMAVAMLYRRWRTKNYLTLTGSIGFALLLFTLFILLRIFQESEMEILNSMETLLLLASVGSIIPFAGTFHFLSPKNKKEFVQLAIFTGSVFILSLALIFLKNLALTATIYFVEIIAYYVFFIIRFLPLIMKKYYFFVAIIFHTLAVVLQTIHTIWANPAVLVISLILQGAFFLALFLSFFDRIMDLVNIALQHSVTDGLTGLYYKTYFTNKVSESLSTNSAIVFSDIDNFKNLNDTQGHDVGDQILKLIGSIMKEVFETKGIAGRYGGEEMVALITKPHADCSHLAEKFRSRVEQESKAIYPVTISVGYRLYDESIVDAATFIRQADIAMYAAKRRGKNRVVEYSELSREYEAETINHKEDVLVMEDSPPEEQLELMDIEKDNSDSRQIETAQVSISAVETVNLIMEAAKENQDEASLEQRTNIIENLISSTETIDSKSSSAEEDRDKIPADHALEVIEDVIPADHALEAIEDVIPAIESIKLTNQSAADSSDQVITEVVKLVPLLNTEYSPAAISARQARFNPFKKTGDSFSNVNLQKNNPKKVKAKEANKSANKDHVDEIEISPLSPEETEAEIERLLEENYRSHYGDRDPNQSISKVKDNSSANENISAPVDASEGLFNNPFKKTLNK